MRGREESGYILKAEPTGFSAGWNGRRECGKSTVALRVLSWKQQEGRGCYRDGEDSGLGGLSEQV